MRALVGMVFLGALCASTVAAAQPIVDGVVDGTYGAAVASDKTGDGNGEAVMDLKDLYLWHDATHLYIALTITGDISATNWGKYLIYIDTTNDTAGGTSDPWTRNVVAQDPHKPEFVLATWLDQSPYSKSRVELWSWGTGTWTKLGGMVDAAAMSGSSSGSVIEMSVKLSALGSVPTIWLEAWSTGGGSNDNAQDTVNSPAEDWNATDWSTQSTLAVSTPYVLVSPDAGVPDAYVADAYVPDAYVADAYVPDAGVPDQALPDTQAPAPDQTLPDALTPDTQTPTPDQSASADGAPAADAGPADQGTTVDSGAPDQGTNADTGGTAGDGAPAADSGTSSKQDEGCSCATGRAPNAGSALLLLLLAGLLLVRRRT